jgi:acyl-CoA reductase-like NAD-dependent aldehyde dehydrogenase
VKRASIKTSSTERARWLSELADALDEAQKVAWRLGVSEGDSVEAKELYGRIEAARAEVDRLRLSGSRRIREESDPDWTDIQLWARRLDPAA